MAGDLTARGTLGLVPERAAASTLDLRSARRAARGGHLGEGGQHRAGSAPAGRLGACPRRVERQPGAAAGEGSRRRRSAGDRAARVARGSARLAAAALGSDSARAELTIDGDSVVAWSQLLIPPLSRSATPPAPLPSRAHRPGQRSRARSAVTRRVAAAAGTGCQCRRDAAQPGRYRGLAAGGHRAGTARRWGAHCLGCATAPAQRGRQRAGSGNPGLECRFHVHPRARFPASTPGRPVCRHPERGAEPCGWWRSH
jgi:hypothetical protein